jgi:hypothetical protein
MVHLDYRDPVHLELFHKWQNDPRVAVNWNETGTLEQHREYLRKMDEDPHQMAVLTKFNDTYFAYMEIYWAKVRSSKEEMCSLRQRTGEADQNVHRRITWGRIIRLRIGIAVVTPWSAMRASEGHIEPPHGGRV